MCEGSHEIQFGRADLDFLLSDWLGEEIKQNLVGGAAGIWFWYLWNLVGPFFGIWSGPFWNLFGALLEFGRGPFGIWSGPFSGFGATPNGLPCRRCGLEFRSANVVRGSLGAGGLGSSCHRSA